MDEADSCSIQDVTIAIMDAMVKDTTQPLAARVGMLTSIAVFVREQDGRFLLGELLFHGFFHATRATISRTPVIARVRHNPVLVRRTDVYK